MLPPMLPLSAVPITSQQDPIRQRPDIPPVVPVQVVLKPGVFLVAMPAMWKLYWGAAEPWLLGTVKSVTYQVNAGLGRLLERVLKGAARASEERRANERSFILLMRIER